MRGLRRTRRPGEDAPPRPAPHHALLERPNTTLCKNHRPAGAEVLPRNWRRDRDPKREARDTEAAWNDYRQYSTVEEKFGERRLEALMTHEFDAKDPKSRFAAACMSGWNHILRAMFTLMLPCQCEGQPEPWRLSHVKEKWGMLAVHAIGGGVFGRAVVHLATAVSQTTCITCGMPGESVNTAAWGEGEADYWVPECRACTADRKRFERASELAYSYRITTGSVLS